MTSSDDEKKIQAVMKVGELLELVRPGFEGISVDENIELVSVFFDDGIRNVPIGGDSPLEIARDIVKSVLL